MANTTVSVLYALAESGQVNLPRDRQMPPHYASPSPLGDRVPDLVSSNPGCLTVACTTNVVTPGCLDTKSIPYSIEII